MRVIIAIEGVVVDEAVRARAAALAAGRYLEEVCGIEDGGRLIGPRHATELQSCGGFEDASELTSALLLYLLAALPPTLRPRVGSANTVAGVQRAFAPVNLRYVELLGRSEVDMQPVLEATAARGGGLPGVRAALGRDTIEGYILNSGPDHLVGRFFDDVYQGMQDQETPLLSPDDFGTISETAHVVGVSGRPRDHLETLLQGFGLAGSFDQLVSREDVSESPPLPAALRLATAKSPDSDEPCFFVCAAPVSVPTGLAAGTTVVGFAHTSAQRRPLMEAGCKVAISRLSTLARVGRRLVETAS